MSTRNEDYERIGRWLDGEDVSLTPAQRALAEEIRADLDEVGAALKVEVPPGVLHRVAARMPEVQPVRRVSRRWIRWVGAAAAAAAVVAAALTLLPRKPTDTQVVPVLTDRSDDLGDLPDTPGAYADELDARVEELAEDVVDLQVALALSEDWPFEMAVMAFEDEIEDLFGDQAYQPDLPPELW